MEDLEEDVTFYKLVRRAIRSMQRERLDSFARSFFAMFNDKENFLEYPRSQERFLDFLDKFDVDYAASGLRINLSTPFIGLANVILAEIGKREKELTLAGRDGLAEARETRQFYVDYEASKSKQFGNDFL
jgi:hypothetical protein